MAAMSEIIKSSAAAIVVSVSMGAAIWWGVVEVRLANAETLITVNKESITEIKEESKDSLKDIKKQVAAIDEKITSILFLLSGKKE
jgi:enoyl-CoA hydratase/carnithine racemase